MRLKLQPWPSPVSNTLKHHIKTMSDISKVFEADDILRSYQVSNGYCAIKPFPQKKSMIPCGFSLSMILDINSQSAFDLNLI